MLTRVTRFGILCLQGRVTRHHGKQHPRRIVDEWLTQSDATKKEDSKPQQPKTDSAQRRGQGERYGIS